MNTKQEIENLKTELNELKARINKMGELLLYPESSIPKETIERMEDFKRYTMKHLRSAFAEAGYPVSDTWIRRQITKGNLILPRSTTHFAKLHLKSKDRRAGAVYQMTKEQIENVVKAFLPGGSGYYNCLRDR